MNQDFVLRVLRPVPVALAAVLLFACGSESPAPSGENVPVPELGIECLPQSLSTQSSSCGGGGGGGGNDLPDLLPQSTLGTYCIKNGSGQLVVTIKNAGTATAAASTTRVSWSCGVLAYVDLATPSLAPGASQSFFVSKPSTCIVATDTFSIAADVNKVVTESNEVNNIASASCTVWQNMP